MQWNTINMTKEELKKRQEEFIKAAIEMSKKSKWTEEESISETVNTNTSDDQSQKDVIETNNETIEINDVKSDPMPEKEDIEVVINSVEPEIVTTASEDIQPEEATTQTPEEIFANIFITEEEAEEKLKEAEKVIKEMTGEIPDFNKYIESHNKENTEKNKTRTADE